MEKIKRQDFLLMEYDSLKKEITAFSDELNTLMKNSILFTGAIYLLILSKDIDISNNLTIKILKYIFWLPPVLNTLLAFRFYSIGTYIIEISNHIQRTERIFLNEGEGWETFLNTKIRGKTRFKMMNMSIPSTAYWAIVIVFSAIIAFVFTKELPSKPLIKVVSKPPIATSMYKQSDTPNK